MHMNRDVLPHPGTPPPLYVEGGLRPTKQFGAGREPEGGSNLDG